MIHLLTVLPEALIELIVEFFVRHDGDRVRLNNTCSFFRSLYPKDAYLKIPLSRFIGTSDELLWAYQNGAGWYGVSNYAVARGYQDVLQYILIEEEEVIMEEQWVYDAIICGRMEIAKWLIEEEDFAWSPRLAVRHTARRGDIKMMRWLQQRGCQLSSDASIEAVRGGRINMLIWLIQCGCYIPPDICDLAAECGKFVILKWLIKKGYRYNYSTLTAARGHKKICEFILSLSS